MKSAEPRVLGIDKDTTKTREDRIIQLSPRALAVLKRQLAHYRDLKARRLIDHNQLFFTDDGTSIRNLSYPAKRWRLSLERLPASSLNTIMVMMLDTTSVVARSRPCQPPSNRADKPVCSDQYFLAPRYRPT